MHRRDKLPDKLPQLFHKCWHCKKIGLKPGILETKHGDYGLRSYYENEEELQLNSSGLCHECETQLNLGK